MRGRLHSWHYQRLVGQLYFTRPPRRQQISEVSNYRSFMSADAPQAGQISEKLLPPGNHDDPMSFFDPILTTYYDTSYDAMRAAIFPSYFHGKCQQDGVEPQGCPNPDCPVVCGTPGSLVHFFPTLRFIAFKSTRDMLQKLCSPSSDEYKQTERAVARAATATRKSGRKQRRGSTFGDRELAQGVPLGKNIQYVRKREENVEKELMKIMAQVPDLLEVVCEGKPTEDASALPGCSWEEAMKAFILSFP
jgi:hypothetical protein